MKIKSLIISILISFIFVFKTFSQDCYTDKKHEINLGYFNIFELNKSHNLGIGYKYHFNQSAVRLNFNFDYKENENEYNLYYNQYIHTDYSLVDYFHYNIKLGYELQTNINRFQVYYGIDIIFENTTSKKDYYDFYSDGFLWDAEEEIKEVGYGVSPFIGLKIFLNKRISISTETNFSISYLDTNSTITWFSSIENHTAKRTYSNKEINLSPLGLLTINFHL